MGRAPPDGPVRPVKGRGALSNTPSRFLGRVYTAVDDGWATASPGHDGVPVGRAAAGAHPASGEWSATEDDGLVDEWPAPAPETELLPDRTVTLIARNQSPDVPFDRSINPFKGCEHGCIYCFARPTHAWLDLSPGRDFETRIFFKTGVRERLEAELGRRGYRCAVLAMGTNTDPYQPVEKSLRITRTVLEVLHAHRHPVSIVTKGQLILRDLDLLADMAAQGLASVAISVTTLDRRLKNLLEPRAADPAARLRIIRQLRDAGIPTSAMLAPVIPFINDHEIETIVGAVADAGALGAGYILLRLPHEVAGLFREWLDAHYPERAERVMAAVRDARGGKDYDASWGQRMTGTGPIAELIGRRFALAAGRHGLRGADEAMLRTDLFRVPARSGQQTAFDFD